jgi:hypothetical protein
MAVIGARITARASLRRFGLEAGVARIVTIRASVCRVDSGAVALRVTLRE